MRRRHQFDGFLSTRPARRALAATLVFEEPQQVERHGPHIILVGEDDHRTRACKASLTFEGPKLHWDVRHPGRQYAAGSATRQIAFEGMPVGHATAKFVDQLARGDPGRGDLHSRIAHPSRYRERPQPLAPVAALASEPIHALLDDVAHPVEGLDVIAQGRPAEEPDLRREGRPLPWQTPPALDAFQHRRLLAADICAGAAAEMDPRMRGQTGGFD